MINEVVYAIAIDPDDTDVIYAGTRWGGVYKSINGGKDWKEINEGLKDNSILTLLISPQNPDIIYAGTWGNGIYKYVCTPPI